MKLNNIINKLKNCNAVLEYIDCGNILSIRMRDLYRRVNLLSIYLTELKITPQVNIGVISSNTLDCIVIDLALIKIGAIHVPLEQLSEFDIVVTALDLKLIIDSTNRFKINNINNIKVMNIKEINNKILKNSFKYSDIKAYTYKANDTIAIKFTSGTTSSSKSMNASVMSVEQTIICIQNIFKHNHKDKILIFLSIYLLQQRYWIYSSILFDFDLILSNQISVFKMIENCHPSVIMGVPEFYISLIKHTENNYVSLKKYLGSNIRYLWSGSSGLNEDVIIFYQKQGINIYQGYGSNEVCIVSKNYPGSNKIGSSGKILDIKKVIISENDEILVKPKYPICLEYHNVALSEQLKITKSGYICTGDSGYIDSDGYLFVKGRINDTIVLSSGRNIEPNWIENMLNKNNDILFSILYGRDKPYVVALFIVNKNANNGNIKIILRELNKKLDNKDIIRKYYLVKDDILNDSEYISNQGKIKRNKIIKKFKSKLDGLYLYSI